MSDRTDDVVQQLRECAHWSRSNGPCDACIAAALRAYAEEARRKERTSVLALIEKMIRVTNVLGDEMCDYCSDETTKWPQHKQDCEHGQLLAAIRAREEKSK